MKAFQLIIRSYAEFSEGVWSVLCLDFDLAAQGSTLEEAKQKLHAMISDYLHDALEGEDQKYAAQLLTRRAPWSEWIKYYLIKWFHSRSKNDHNDQVFDETMPLRPA